MFLFRDKGGKNRDKTRPHLIRIIALNIKKKLPDIQQCRVSGSDNTKKIFQYIHL